MMEYYSAIKRTRYNTDELWKHYLTWKKSDTKGHILYDSIFMKYSEQANPYRQKINRRLPGAEMKEKWEVTANG